MQEDVRGSRHLPPSWGAARRKPGANVTLRGRERGNAAAGGEWRVLTERQREDQGRFLFLEKACSA